MEEVKNEFTRIDSNNYELVGKKVAPDGILRNFVYDNKQDRYGYLVKRKHIDDVSYYAPYILYQMSQKIGIKTFSSELGNFMVLDPDEKNYSQSFFESSCVFLEDLSRYHSYDVHYIPSDVIYDKYVSEKPTEIQKIRNQKRSLYEPMTIEEILLSQLHMLAGKENEKEEEISRQQNKQPEKQELIDRIVLELQLGAIGENAIISNGKNILKLAPYFLKVNGLLGINKNKDWIEKQLSLSDEEYQLSIDRNFPLQYTISSDNMKQKPETIFHYLLHHYPEETEEAYHKVKQYTLKDLHMLLDSFTLLDKSHKAFALRFFKVREALLEKVYEQYETDKFLSQR